MVVRREKSRRRIRLSTKTRVAKASVEKAVNAMAGGRLAAEPSCNDVELVLIDQVGDTGKADASYFRRGIEKIGGDVSET